MSEIQEITINPFDIHNLKKIRHTYIKKKGTKSYKQIGHALIFVFGNYEDIFFFPPLELEDEDKISIR